MMSKHTSAFMSPFWLWSALAVKTSEMMMASASVIAHRTDRMAKSSSPPGSADQKEFTLMAQEKVDAAQESALATGLAMMRMGPATALRNVQQMMAITTDMLSLATSRTQAQAFQRQAKMMRTLTSKASMDMSSDAARLADKALTPLHKRATKNAKRLNRLPL